MALCSNISKCSECLRFNCSWAVLYSGSPLCVASRHPYLDHLEVTLFLPNNQEEYLCPIIDSTTTIPPQSAIVVVDRKPSIIDDRAADEGQYIEGVLTGILIGLFLGVLMSSVMYKASRRSRIQREANTSANKEKRDNPTGQSDGVLIEMDDFSTTEASSHPAAQHTEETSLGTFHPTDPFHTDSYDHASGHAFQDIPLTPEVVHIPGEIQFPLRTLQRPKIPPPPRPLDLNDLNAEAIDEISETCV